MCMDLDVIEVLTIAGEGAGAQHWSRNATRPRYSLDKDEVKEANETTRFTCFDVAERVEADHELLFAGRVSRSPSLSVGCYALLACCCVQYQLPVPITWYLVLNFAICSSASLHVRIPGTW